MLRHYIIYLSYLIIIKNIFFEVSFLSCRQKWQAWCIKNHHSSRRGATKDTAVFLTVELTSKDFQYPHVRRVGSRRAL